VGHLWKELISTELQVRAAGFLVQILAFEHLFDPGVALLSLQEQEQAANHKMVVQNNEAVCSTEYLRSRDKIKVPLLLGKGESYYHAHVTVFIHLEVFWERFGGRRVQRCFVLICLLDP
jgi:hypothetical protein